MRWRLRETQQLRNSASHPSTKWCIWKQQQTCIQELRDGLTFEGQEQRDEFSTKDEDIEYDLLVPKQENLVGKQEWLMSYGTCQLPLRVFVFFLVSLACLSPLGFPDFFVVLLRIRGFQRSEFVNSFQQQPVCRYVFFSSSYHDLMYCTLSLTVG